MVKTGTSEDFCITSYSHFKFLHSYATLRIEAVSSQGTYARRPFEEVDRELSDELDEEAEENEVEILDEPERGRRAPRTRQSGGRGRSTRKRGGPRSGSTRGRGHGKKNN